MNSIPVYFYPVDMCESCINEIDELVTSGELIEANDRLKEVQEEGYTCLTCLQLEKENN